MGIVDVLTTEDRVQVKFSDFYSLVKEATKAEFLMNGIAACVDHSSMYAMATGKLPESTELLWTKEETEDEQEKK